MRKPNILLIMSDQFRFDAAGCNGNDIVKTPHLDRLAAGGINFINAFTPNPICVPARACLTTGCYPHKCIGGKINSGSILPGFPLLGDQLEARGYRTYAMGKLHYEPYSPPGKPRTTHGLKTVELVESGRILKEYDPYGKMKGLEDYHDYLHTVGWGGFTRGHGLGNNDVYPAPSPIPQEYYVDTWVANRSLEYLTKHMKERRDQPFFMWTSFPKPHSAFDPPRPYDQMYHPLQMPDPVGNVELLKERGLDLLLADHYKYIWDLLSPEAMKVIKAHYYGLISHQDVQIGRLLDFLEKHDLDRETVVVFVSDHGEMLGDFGLYFKRNFYNGSVRIPFMIRYPENIAPGLVSDELVGLQDLLPTLLAFTGEPLAQAVDGLDLTPVLAGSGSVRDCFVSQCGNDPVQQYMVADKEWKYIYHQHGGVEELYRQQDDRFELHNLADHPSADIQNRKNQFRNYLIEWCTRHGDTDMLEHHDLKISVEPFRQIINERSLPFGRRYY